METNTTAAFFFYRPLFFYDIYAPEKSMKKCDEVTALTNDLVLHSISDLNMLQMKPEEFSLVPFLQQSIDEISAEYGDVIFEKTDLLPVIYADKKRINQIMENLINNSRKYAKTDMKVSITRKSDEVAIHFRDYGKGIPDEDMPFITDKFYRGKNVGKENGSGLGLYIVKYIAEQSEGNLELINHTSGEGGLEVIVTLPIKKSENDFS